MTTNDSLSTARRRVTRALAGIELPGCWASGSAIREAIILAKPVAERTEADRRDLKREAAKAYRISETQS